MSTVKQRNTVIERGIRVVNSGGEGGGGDFNKQAVQLIHEMHDKREHEKQELQHLNDRFSSYVERVRALEAMNRKLLADIEDLKAKWGFDSSKIKDQMEPELLKFREHIDEITRLKAVAEIKAKRAESDALQFRHLMDLAMDSFNTDKNKIGNLERLLDNTRQDAEYLKGQLNDLNDQMAKYAEEQKRLMEQLKQLKNDLDKETIQRVARQNEVQTLEEQISFLKAVHEQEVSELSRLQTIVGFDPAQFYRNELERAIRDIRGDFEQLNHEQKRELEEWYRIKTEEVEKEALKEREYARTSMVGLSAEETSNLRTSHTDSQREYSDLQRKHSELSMRLREFEERFEETKITNQSSLAERDREIMALRDQINDLMQTYDELMSRKTSLEFEINTYRRLLECEETRIKSPSSSTRPTSGASGHISSSSSTTTSTRGGGGGGRGGGGGGGTNASSVITGAAGSGSGKGDKDRDDASSAVGGILAAVAATVGFDQDHKTAGQQNQQQGQQGGQPSGSSSTAGNIVASSATGANKDEAMTGGSRTSITQRGSSTELSSETITKRMQVQRTSKGPVGIKEISPDGKFVLIENTGKRGDLDISKWCIKRKVDNHPDIVYVFAPNTIIGSGRTIKIWSHGQGRANPPGELVHDVEWASGDSMVTRLLSDSGEERALYSQRAST